MGRPGGRSSSSHRSSSNSSRRSSSHSSSRSSSSHNRPSSSRSYSSSSYHSHSSGHHGGHYSPPPHHYHYSSGGYRSSGYRSSNPISSIVSGIITLCVCFIFISIFISIVSGNGGYKANKIDQEAVAQYAEAQYPALFKDESHLLLVYTYFEKSDTDYATLVFGNDASEIISNDVEDYFWERYDRYYSDSSMNESEWLGNTFKDAANKWKSEGQEQPLNNLKSFNKGCYDDNLKWIKSNEKSALIKGCEEFYETTGVQPYIILIDYTDIPGVVVQQSTAGKFGTTVVKGIIVLIIAGTVIFITNKIIKEKKRQREELERTLNTPINSNTDNDNNNINT